MNFNNSPVSGNFGSKPGSSKPHDNFKIMDIFTESRAAMLLNGMPEVDIGSSGDFIYILARVITFEKGDNTDLEIVRGYEWSKSHGELFRELKEDLRKCGRLDCELIGGGRIIRNPEKKTIYLYGSIRGIGKTNHALAGEKLQAWYTQYEVSWQKECYSLNSLN